LAEKEAGRPVGEEEWVGQQTGVFENGSWNFYFCFQFISLADIFVR
jgi:hypothetical protein